MLVENNIFSDDFIKGVSITLDQHEICRKTTYLSKTIQWNCNKGDEKMNCYRPECHLDSPCIYCGGKKNSNDVNNHHRSSSESGDE